MRGYHRLSSQRSGRPADNRECGRAAAWLPADGRPAADQMAGLLHAGGCFKLGEQRIHIAPVAGVYIHVAGAGQSDDEPDSAVRMLDPRGDSVADASSDVGERNEEKCDDDGECEPVDVGQETLAVASGVDPVGTERTVGNGDNNDGLLQKLPRPVENTGGARVGVDVPPSVGDDADVEDHERTHDEDKAKDKADERPVARVLHRREADDKDGD